MPRVETIKIEDGAKKPRCGMGYANASKPNHSNYTAKMSREKRERESKKSRGSYTSK